MTASREATIAKHEAKITPRQTEITELKQCLAAREEMISRAVAQRPTYTAQRQAVRAHESLRSAPCRCFSFASCFYLTPGEDLVTIAAK
jgi:hypothetical protein